MTVERVIELQQYHEAARAEHDHGHVMVVHNCSSHYLVVDVELVERSGPPRFGMVLASFRYDLGNALYWYRKAMSVMVDHAIRRTNSLSE